MSEFLGPSLKEMGIEEEVNENSTDPQPSPETIAAIQGNDPETDDIEDLDDESDDTDRSEEDPLAPEVTPSSVLSPEGIARIGAETSDAELEEESTAQETNNTDSEYEAMDDGGNKESETLDNPDGTAGSK